MNAQHLKQPLPLKERLFKLQCGICWICLEPMTLDRQHVDFATIDHVVPLARSGSNNPKNKLLAHKRCNEERGAPQPTERLRATVTSALRRIKQRVEVNKKFRPLGEFLDELANDPRIARLMTEARRRLAPRLYPEGGAHYERMMRGESPPTGNGNDNP